MIHRPIIRAQAEADITDAAIWYHNRQAGLGEEFLAEVQAAIERAAANPRHHRRLRRRPEVRRVATPRFPFQIFFIVRPDNIVVFRVLHAARHDREWKGAIAGD
jgi:plasmid stabilization system protein ParE